MPNSPDIHKRMLSLRISRELYRRLQIEAHNRRMGFNEFVRHLIYEASEHVFLTKEDYDAIGREQERCAKRKNTIRRVSEGAEIQTDDKGREVVYAVQRVGDKD